MAWRLLGRAGCGLLLALAGAAPAAAAPPPDPAEAIFRQGILPSGAPLQGQTGTGAMLAGAGAACANCHRRSGLGAIEGRSSIPPITGRYLYRSPMERGDETPLPYVEGMRGNRAAYTDATLVRAIREGIDAEGQPLSPLMPRFQLDAAQTAALIGYLKKLDVRRVPGISDTELHLATIITPDADPVAKAGMLAVMKQFFADANAVHVAPNAGLRPSGRTMYSKSMYRMHRQWVLHVWQLEGAPETWPAQLERKLAAEPVFAALSGLAGATWAPVHAFCEQARLPCIFPNVEAPPRVGAGDFDSVYFSQGVILEAGLIGSALAQRPADAGPLQVVQVYRAGDVGEAAARTLADALAGGGPHGATATNIVLPQDGGTPQEREQALADALRRAQPADVRVLWLRPADLGTLAAVPVPTTGATYFSGLMGGLERAPLPAAWRPTVVMTQPFDLPERRRVRVDFAMGWFTLRHVPIVAPRIQADTYLACGLLSEILNHSADVAVREYLIEKFEDLIEHRVVTGYYPRLTLAPGQRFGSKGGYLVRFAASEGLGVRAEGVWTVP